MECRMNCGACCEAPSITSYIPGMPEGKPAGTRCIHLSDDNLCKIFGCDDRPNLCDEFKATSDVCGKTRIEALRLITELEILTAD